MARKKITTEGIDSSTQRFQKLLQQHMAIEEAEAVEAGALGFMTRLLIQTTLPHRDPGEQSLWGRQNGNVAISLQPGTQPGPEGVPVSVGLPYGTIPRILMMWVTTEAVRTGNRDLSLGPTLSSFMRELDMVPSGGRWGTITRLREQMKRLFSSRISYSYLVEEEGGESRWSHKPLNVGETHLYWDPKHPDQAAMWESVLKLDEAFFDEITDGRVPIDLRAVKALQASTMELDIYLWLTHRYSYLRSTSRPIPWAALANQFGSEYSNLRDFKKNFLRALKNVLVVYPQARLLEDPGGIVLQPSRTHIRRVPKELTMVAQKIPGVGDERK